MIEKSINLKTIEFMINNINSFDYSELEEARFFYLGKPTKNNDTTTFYLILHRYLFY
jgi:hypothetical protein